MTDLQLAQNVRDAVTALNTALRAAHDAGLHVDLDYANHQTVDMREPVRIYHASIERRQRISG